MNLAKCCYGDFSVFVSTPNNIDTIYSHRHEDLLSYVIFKKDQPILIDPGRKTYANTHECKAELHNGLVVQGAPLLPLYRFFFGRSLRAEPQLSQTKGRDRTQWVAEHRVLGVKKTLEVYWEEAREQLVVEETVYTKQAERVHFSLNGLSHTTFSSGSATGRAPVHIDYDEHWESGFSGVMEWASEYGERRQGYRVRYNTVSPVRHAQIRLLVR